MEYEERILYEVLQWKLKLHKRASLVRRTSKSVQAKLQSFLPKKADRMLAAAFKQLATGILAAPVYKKGNSSLQLEEMDRKARNAISLYQKTAAAEGAGTGAGGLLLGTLDLPFFFGLQAKLLSEVAAAYGLPAADKHFLAHLFWLSYASEKDADLLIRRIENWQEDKRPLSKDEWKSFQQDYLDSIELAKLLQVIPGLGALTGGTANYQLAGRLGTDAMNACRARIFKEKGKL
ncbi:EcsC family protein [Metabacillus sp. GX 13764]|uniref:EcsC family protein n=1 Tax=Metabacillus kandeliae TaxID=2900151 RepID=UPI001E512C56|nr:EcsC family protein [Metabacillus kandeliae]MCD7034865.1 EcsC family protein [Metabacillus kandeliae]